MIGRGIATRIALAALVAAASGSLILAIGVAVVGADVFRGADGRGRRLGRPRPGDVRRVGHDRRPRGGRRGRRRERRPGGRPGPDARPAAGRGRRRRPADRRRATTPPASRATARRSCASLADSFNQMAASLERQEPMRRDFIANAAHELRTPLTNLQGYLEALRDGVIAADRATYDSLLRGGRPARPAVALARCAGRGRRRDGAAAARGARPRRWPSARRSSSPSRRSSGPASTLVVDVPERLPARANPDHLAQVLANLL